MKSVFSEKIQANILTICVAPRMIKCSLTVIEEHLSVSSRVPASPH